MSDAGDYCKILLDVSEARFKTTARFHSSGTFSKIPSSIRPVGFSRRFSSANSDHPYCINVFVWNFRVHRCLLMNYTSTINELHTIRSENQLTSREKIFPLLTGFELRACALSPNRLTAALKPLVWVMYGMRSWTDEVQGSQPTQTYQVFLQRSVEEFTYSFNSGPKEIRAETFLRPLLRELKLFFFLLLKTGITQ